MKLYAYKFYRTPGSKAVWDFVNAPSPDAVVNFVLHCVPTALVCEPKLYSAPDPYFREISDFFRDENFWR